MLNLFSGLKDFIQTYPTDIDSIFFKVHYRITAFTLAIFAICVTSFQYIGDPISCTSSHLDSDPAGETEMLETYCWIHATFTLPSAVGKVGVDVAFPGVGQVTDENKHEVVYHNYYQWVGFVLMLQAVLFYTPRYLWLSIEGHRIHNLVLQLNMPIVQEEAKSGSGKGKKTGTGEIISAGDLDQRIGLIAKYFVKSMRTHKIYAAGYFICEILTFINVVGQIFLVDRFLGGEFSKYGSEVIRFSNYNQEERIDPMVRVFPRMTKCTFFQFGTSGDIQKHDALCLLPLNILNEKLYVICWFWFIALAVATGIGMLRIPLVLFSKLRYFFISKTQMYCDQLVLQKFVSRGEIGDWLLLLLFGRNVDAIHFKSVVDEIGVLLQIPKETDNMQVDDANSAPTLEMTELARRYQHNEN